MTKLLATTIAALSIAAASTAVASTNPTDPATAVSTNAALTAGKPAPLLLAQRRRKCQEDLGYGRTGSYGCG
jgi:hypothetical protein